jgi:hypothetical protein
LSWGGTISEYRPLFRDNVAGRTFQSIDYSLGWLTQAAWDGPVRGLFSNLVPTPKELNDAKIGVVLAAVPVSRLAGGASGTRAIAAGASTRTAELIPTHGMTLSRARYAALRQDISLNGIRSPINYVEVNGRKYVLDGHHRLRAARELGIDEVPTERVELPFLGYETIDDLFRGF